MNYSCEDYRSVIACESARLREEDFSMPESKYCPICSSENPEVFYCDADDECIGCSECVTGVDWGSF